MVETANYSSENNFKVSCITYEEVKNCQWKIAKVTPIPKIVNPESNSDY